MSGNNVSREVLMEVIAIQTEIVQQGMDLGKIMDLVTQRAQYITNAEGACVELIENTELGYRAASGLAEKFLGLRLSVENSLSGECIKKKTALISHDIENDNRVNKVACRKMGLKSMVVMPLICAGEVVGVLKVLSDKTNHFKEESIEILELITGVIAASMVNAIRNDTSELIHMATHDSLTGISNRALFYERLRQKLAHGICEPENFGLITLDMDKLKEINDTYGHRAGDAAIIQVAHRMKEEIRESDTVSRLGGDEFGAIISNLKDRNELIELILRLESKISQAFQFENHEIVLAASIGYALFSEDGIELDVLIEKADRSMYEVKRTRKGVGNVR